MLKKTLTKNISEKLNISFFTKNILTLVTGSVIAQAIPLLVTPVLTRIYSPENFGLLALYIGISSIIANIASGRYELAIILPKSLNESKSIIKLSIVISFFISAIFFLVIVGFNSHITSLLGNEKISPWLYFIPVSILLNGAYQSYYYWMNKNRRYKQMSISKITRTSTTSIAAIILNFFPLGLLFAQLLGRLSSTLYLLIYAKKKYPIRFFTENHNINTVAIKYKQFPLYDIPTSLISSSTQNLPNILFNTIFSAISGGYYYLANRVIGLPITLVSRAFLDIFKQQAAEEYSEVGNSKKAFMRTFKIMLLLGFIPFTIFFIYSEEIFSIVLGKEWYIAGTYAKILIPMVFLRFLAGPVSFMFYIANKQLYNLIGQFSILSLLIVSFLIGHYYDSELITLYIISVSFSIFYIIYIFISYKLAINKK